MRASACSVQLSISSLALATPTLKISFCWSWTRALFSERKVAVHVKNPRVIFLGVIFDQCINMYEHVTSVCRALYYHLNNIHRLKVFLTQEILVTVVHAFVTSRIDYCNSMLYGISNYNINRLQRIQNSAARIVKNTRKYDHITPILQKTTLATCYTVYPFQDFINNLWIY